MSAPFKARLHHLDRATRAADVGASGTTIELADARELEPWLVALAALSDSGDAEPALHLQRSSQRWRLRPRHGRLAVDDPTRPQAGFYERTPAEFLAELAPSAAPAAAENIFDPALTAPSSRGRAGLLAALALGAAAAVGLAVWIFLRSDAPPLPDYEWVVGADAAALGRRVAGRYSTGAEPGDRVLALDTASVADWSKLDAKALPEETEGLVLRPARLDGREVLVLADRPEIAIELPDADTLRLHGDTYRRLK